MSEPFNIYSFVLRGNDEIITFYKGFSKLSEAIADIEEKHWNATSFEIFETDYDGFPTCLLCMGYFEQKDE